MVFGDALTKASRLVELQLLFSRHPAATHSTAELARHLGVAVRTVRNYVNELSQSGRLPVYSDEGRWHLTPGARFEIPPVTFLLEEAAAVYLAARLLCRHSDEPNPAVRQAVAKLAEVVPEDLAQAMRALTDSLSGARSEPYDEAFRTLALSWALRREAELSYHPLNAPAPRTYRFQTYLLEPALRGFAVYAVGRAEPPGELRVFKLERVTAARLTDITFEPPPIATLLERIDASWGIWLADGDAVEVRLRFDASVARAVRETRWHPSQRLTESAGGALEMRLALTSTVEFVPWVLGWGTTCEVLAPESLRSQVASTLGAAASLYRSDTPKARS